MCADFRQNYAPFSVYSGTVKHLSPILHFLKFSNSVPYYTIFMYSVQYVPRDFRRKFYADQKYSRTVKKFGQSERQCIVTLLSPSYVCMYCMYCTCISLIQYCQAQQVLSAFTFKIIVFCLHE